MPSLVEELQKDALNQSVRVTELLQKSLVVATKLKLDDFASWVRLELDGYGDKKVPEYRVLNGIPRVFNPYQGYQPLHFEDVKDAKRFSRMRFPTPIGKLEDDIINTGKSRSGMFNVTYSPEVEKMLMAEIKFGLQPSLHFTTSQFQSILNAVRKIILEWSLRLEADGITGKGMSFSREEKERAHSITFNIKNLIHGNIKDSQIQIEAIDSVQTKTSPLDITQLSQLVDALKASVGAISIAEEEKRELNSEIGTLEAQIHSPKPKDLIIRECLGSVRRILEGAGGDLVAGGILYQLSKFFGA